MRVLSALLLSGILFMFAAVMTHGPSSRAMQPTSTPPSAASLAFCSADEEERGEALGVFDPTDEAFGAVDAIDVEETDEARRFEGSLRLNFLTLPPNTCLAGSVFYPAGIITVRDIDPNVAESVEILVEPGPGGDTGAPAPEGTIRPAADGGMGVLDFSQPITIIDNQWVRIRNRAIVGFRNHGTDPVTILVAGIHPTSGPGSGDCGGGCRSRP